MTGLKANIKHTVITEARWCSTDLIQWPLVLLFFIKQSIVGLEIMTMNYNWQVAVGKAIRDKANNKVH